ncbi:rhombosortase [Nibricoccus aquaticus]|uniref:Rhombosortase n=1 Tax=Nibricoccus aquaticus TaxID=2576891 RepID=A0A290Q2F5_9BACT|nr:rhombosortase [Nibricoccus aquaticus]ATC62694.1 rhombosortase [Nibricoccus aquaticus]
MKRFPFLTLLFGAVAVATHAIPGMTEALQFDRSAFSRGEVWRLITGHFTHFGADHLRWDVIAFVAFGSLVEFRSRRAWIYCVAISAVVISFGVSWLQPQFTLYRGLSGLDSALFAFVATDLVREGRRSKDKLMIGLGALALSGFLAKCVYELVSGRTLFVETGDAFQPVPLAHLLGAVIGVLTAQEWKNRRAAVARTEETQSPLGSGL